MTNEIFGSPSMAAYRAQAIDLIDRLGTIAVLDLETSSLSPAQGRAVEVAIGLFKGGEMLTSFSTILKGPIEARSLKNGVPEEALPDAPTFSNIAPIVRGIVDEAQFLLGQNIGFDQAWVVAESKRCGVEIALPPAIDTIALGKAAFPGLISYRLDELSDAAGVVPHVPRHRALPDVFTEHDVFVAAIAELVRVGVVKSTSDIASYVGKGIRRWDSSQVPEQVADPALADLVDRFGEMVAERERLSGEITMVESALTELAAKTGKKVLSGKRYVAQIGGYMIWKVPRDDHAAAMTKTILEECGLADEYSETSAYLLAKGIRAGRLSEPVVEALSHFGRLEQVTRVKAYPRH